MNRIGVVSIFAELDRRRGVESTMRPEEVLMHPMLIKALADEQIKDRREEAAKFVATGESGRDDQHRDQAVLEKQ